MTTRFRTKNIGGGLVIQLKEGKSVLINSGEIVVKVLEIQGKYARIVFKADKDILINREKEDEQT